MERESELTKETNTRQKLVRALFFVAGTVSLAIGTIGIVLPILPTTPLLLLALACYCRSSKRMTKWVLTNKYFGSYIRRYKEGKGIPIKTKIIAIATLDNNKLLSVFHSEHLVDSSTDFVCYSNRSKHTHHQTANIQGNQALTAT